MNTAQQKQKNSPLEYEDDLSDENSDVYMPETISAKAHFIWLGKASLPEHARYNIIDFKRKNPAYEVNLWTDNPVKIEKEISASGLSLKGFKEKITIRNILSAYENLNEVLTNPFSMPREVLLESAINRELNGAYKNIPAASDLLRYAIVDGLYMDVDTHTKGPVPAISAREGVLFHSSAAGALANSIIASEQDSVNMNTILNKALSAYDKKARAPAFSSKKTDLMKTIDEIGLKRIKGESPAELDKKYNELSAGNITSVMYGAKRNNSTLRMKVTSGVSGPDLIADFILNEIASVDTKMQDYLFTHNDLFGQRGEFDIKTGAYRHLPWLNGAGHWARFQNEYRRGRRDSY